ncbi:MAG: hypothetical protein Q9196_004796 [Gyalolechia fulgens]
MDREKNGLYDGCSRNSRAPDPICRGIACGMCTWLIHEGSLTRHSSTCLEPRVWQLIRELLRLPVANLARLLRTHSFVTILHKTLKALKDSLPTSGTLAQHEPQSPTNGTSRESSAAADSSSVTIDGSVDLPKTGKKRKRGGTPIEHHHRVITGGLDIGLLYESICGVIRYVQALSKDDSYGCAVEYLKKSLQAPTEQAAEMLGASLTLTDYVLGNVAEARSLAQEDLIRRYVDPWVKMWTSRASRTIKTTRELLFSTTSFLPALKLLSSLDDLTSGLGTESPVLESLLLQHVVLPSRESFESSKRPRAAQADGGSTVDIDQLLAPLHDPAFRSEHRQHPQNKTIHPVARFYDIVLKHTLLSTQKQRISESAWLEYLFDRIAFQGLDLVADAPGSATTPDTTDAVKDMLHLLVDREMKLQIATLEKVLSQCSHVLEGDYFHVDWVMVGLCFHIDPDVFVIPTISKDTLGQPIRRPNQYLSALFARLNENSLSSDTTFEVSRQTILRTVLVPLVKGFAQARDLLGFIKHWRSNLMLTLRLSNDSEKPSDSRHDDHELSSVAPDGQNIWEDEDLLQAVAAQVEQRLFAGEMEAIFKDLSAAFVPANATEDAEQPQSAATSLIILDCILSGCHSENTMRQLSVVIEDLYKTLLAISEADSMSHRHSWRAWRCISKIKSRWRVDVYPSLDVQEVEKGLAGKALKFIAQMDQSCPSEDLLQSLNFVLSVIEARGDLSKHTELANSTIQAVMDQVRQTDGCFELEESKLAKKYLLYSMSRPFLQNLQTNVGRAATSELQRSFFEHLFQCGLGDFAASQPTSSRPIPYSAAWRNFLHSKVLEEDNALAKNFRAFQMDKILAFQSDDPDKLSDEDRAAYSLAFDSVHQAPLCAFNRKQRSKIFNRVFESLLQDKFLTPQLLKDHLKLLISYLSHPNRYMTLVRDPFNIAQDAQETGVQKAGLFQMANSIGSRITSPTLDTEAVDLVKRLAEKVLESQLTNSMDESAILCMSLYFEGLKPAKYYCANVGIITLVLMGVSLDFYRAHFKDFPEDLQRSLENLSPLCMDFLKIVCRFVDDSCKNTTTLSGICEAGVAAGCLVPFADILLASPELPSVNADLEQLATKALGLDYQNSSSADELAVGQALKEFRRTLRLLGAPNTSEYLEMCSKDGDVVSTREQRSFISEPMDWTANLDSEKRASIIMELLSRTADVALTRNTLLLLQRLIVFRGATNFNFSEDFLAALASVIHHLCDALLQPQSFQVLVLSLQNINFVLQKHPRVMIQWHIDQIMAVITTCASRPLSSTSYTPKQNGLLYLALCRLFSTILAFHRKRLGGRYHLILPALQSLLRPLFIPFTAIRPSHASSSHPYTKTHASAYSRLLLQIADPPISSLTPRHRSGKENLNLTDATKTAKSVAGQHLHYVVMTYCECQLKGRLEKEVREQLKPGLWAMLDVIPQEVMRVMNGAMGKEGRGVWKAVYSEWRRERGGSGR